MNAATINFKLNSRRRLALCLGLPIALGLVAYMALNWVSLVSEDSYTVRPVILPPRAELSLTVGSGNVSLALSTDRFAHASGVVNYSLFRPHLRWVTTPDGSVISGANCFWIGACGVSLDLAVPAGERVEAFSGSGDIDAEDLRSSLHAHDGSGDIELVNLSGPLALDDGSGDVTGSAISSTRVSADVGSGDVHLSFASVPDQVKVNDSSGDITVALPVSASYMIVAKTGSGTSTISVPVNSSSHHVIYLDDGSGDIDVVPYSP